MLMLKLNSVNIRYNEIIVVFLLGDLKGVIFGKFTILKIGNRTVPKKYTGPRLHQVRLQQTVSFACFYSFTAGPHVQLS